jgi:hypothetical protein
MAEWSRVVNTTIREYIKGEEPNVLRNRKLTALLRERGRITFNHSGEQLDWKVRYRRAPLTGFADSDTLTFSRQNRWKTAVLPWRGYASTDSMTKKERLMNKSVAQIVNIYENVAKLLMEDIEDNFEDELYIDGNAAANTKRLHGAESALGDAANTMDITSTTGAERSENVADKAAAPNDTYAGLVTRVGNYGGTWAGSWPDGTGDSHFDFWSPTMVNPDSTAFGGATDDFAGQGDEAMRYLIIRSQKNKSRRGQLDLILLNSAFYEQLLNIIDGRERFISRPGRNEGSLAKLGFTDVVSFDGVEVTWCYGVTADTGYGFNVDEMELCSLQSQLFVPEGPDFDIASQSWRFSIDMYGNLKLNPRCLGKIFPFVT